MHIYTFIYVYMYIRLYMFIYLYSTHRPNRARVTKVTRVPQGLLCWCPPSARPWRSGTEPCVPDQPTMMHGCVYGGE